MGMVSVVDLLNNELVREVTPKLAHFPLYGKPKIKNIFFRLTKNVIILDTDFNFRYHVVLSTFNYL